MGKEDNEGMSRNEAPTAAAAADRPDPQNGEPHQVDPEQVKASSDPWCDENHPRMVNFDSISAAAFRIKSGIVRTPCDVSVASRVAFRVNSSCQILTNRLRFPAEVPHVGRPRHGDLLQEGLYAVHRELQGEGGQVRPDDAGQGAEVQGSHRRLGRKPRLGHGLSRQPAGYVSKSS